MIFNKLKYFFSILKRSLSGSEENYTEGKISKGIILLAIPMILEMFMESVFAIVDIIFVAKLGHNSVTAVGLTESVMTIVYAIGVGLSTATSAVISRRTGEKNYKQARFSAGQSIVLGMLVSIPMSVAGLFFAPDILRLMGADEAVIETGSNYTMIVLGSNTVIVLLFVINAAFRSTGDAATAMRVLLIANVLNIILDPLLIFGFGPIPAMGITGAAIATTIGRGVAVLYQFYLLFTPKREHNLRLKINNLVPNIGELLRLAKISGGGIFQYLISTFSWVILIRMVSSFGSVVVAGYTIGIRVILFLMLPAWGLSNTASVLTGQNLGAGKPERAKRTVIQVSVYTTLYMLVCGVLLFFFGDTILALLSDDIKIVEHGFTVLQILAFGFIFFGLGGVFMQAINGAGDTYTPTVVNFIVFWMIEIPLAYVLSFKLGFNERGAYITIVLMDSLLAVIAFVLFKRGKWMSRKV